VARVPFANIEELLQRGYRYALALTHDPSAAEDVLQDAWVSVLGAGSVRSPGVLFRAIRTRFIDRYRRSRLVVMSSLDQEDAPESWTPTVDFDLDALLAGDVLQRALATLRSEEREALYLWAVEGYTAVQIGELSDRSAGAVRVLLWRIRGKLRALIEKEESQWAAG
jgi:RNA polymerase sigma-70 factor (ECF subfamily)